MRLKETPWGVARFAYAYLGALGASLAGVLVGVIASPIASAVPMCREDEWGFCAGGMTVLVVALSLVGLFFLVGFSLRLGWQWGAWCVGFGLIVAQVVIETDWLSAFWVYLGVPAIAAGLSFRRPDKEISRLWWWISVGVLIAILVQFLVWFVVLVVS